MRYFKLFILIFFISYYTSSANSYTQESACFLNKSTKIIYICIQEFQSTRHNNIESNKSIVEKIRLQLKGSIYLKLTSYLLIFCLGYLSAMMYSKYKIKNIMGEEYDEYKNKIKSSKKYPSSIYGIILLLKNRKNDYKNSKNPISYTTKSNDSSNLERLKNEIENLTSRNRELEKKYFDSIEIPKSNSEKIMPEETGNLNIDEIKNNTLYFSIPEKDGTFLVEKSTISAIQRSYYMIEFKGDEKMGKLIYRSGNLDDSAISQMDYILGPVCEIENSLMNNPTKIIIEAQGTVLKDDGKWKIKDKIKIKLI